MPPQTINQDSFSPDIQDFIVLLYKYQVEYMIVGGEAVIYYGYARLTGDIDFFYNNSAVNTQRLFDAINEFWEGNIPGSIKHEELKEPGVIVQFGRPPNRIDLINSIDGVEFQNAWQERETAEMYSKGESIPVIYIGRKSLIKNKKAAGRPKDLDDLDYLCNPLSMD